MVDPLACLSRNVPDPDARAAMSRNTAQSQHPNFPWLSANDPGGVERFLSARGWLQPGERVVDSRPAGAGNMNLTLRVQTSTRSVILKQARPWVEKFDHLAAPWDRILFEARFYGRVADIVEVARRMPRLMEVDAEARALLLEDLGDARDLTGMYHGEGLEVEVAHALGAYLAALHSATQGDHSHEFANREMRALNHEHIYEVPLDPENGLSLEQYERGLQQVARGLQADSRVRELVRETGARYLGDGQCLVQGDFFPGSWLLTAREVMVIDPEFCFYGDAEFDLGVAVAHFALAQQPAMSAALFEAYERERNGVTIDRQWIARYAACEVIRRLLGVAQLPIRPSTGFRRSILMRARRALVDQDLEVLCS